MDLEQCLQQVHDEQSFLDFVQALIADRRQAQRMAQAGEADSWQNHCIEDFLDGAHAWAEATGIGATQGLVEASPWQRFAVFLYCGKIYE
ncbi:hypothetical protein EDF83_3373 [Pseudomonas protegens]|jgi:hypothetical protein|uniref:DUF7660 domain-containing protein n=2 Tax=Pseudomonas TaxID=286 RepID=A0AAU7WL89_9PSED|nr:MULTISPECIES: hypothetical protein [Pseudomonas]APC21090.1 hypothetical protein BME99_13465 [Pseudomonas protegens]KAF0864626.1 hypothetical protein PLD_29015 [Pseudomonas sp. LD120]MBB1616745.1 hypothetical protein [Pseudomonas sp. UMC65]MBB1618578.1 hypothetical protein [Pseudomonas sp. UME65]MBF0641885.1 hypothetical protein [Pseudomonas protegens]